MRRQWLKFFFLRTGEWFYIGKADYKKDSFCTAEEINTGDTVIVFPWRKVRSFRLFGGTPVPPQTPKPPLP